MNSVKKSFLRTCINHGSIPIDKAQYVLQALCEAHEVDNTINMKELVSSINTSLIPFDQRLTFYKHPLFDGPEFLVFGLTFETGACKKQMHYSDSDRYYFLKLMESTVKGEDYGISWVDIYNVIDNSAAVEKKLPKHKMQELVQKWTMQGYFLEKDEKLYLGPRMIVEYGTHLKLNYPESMSDCPLCNKLVLWDVKCKDCGVKLHRECIRTFLIRKSNCPACKKTWNTRLSSEQ